MPPVEWPFWWIGTVGVPLVGLLIRHVVILLRDVIRGRNTRRILVTAPPGTRVCERGPGGSYLEIQIGSNSNRYEPGDAELLRKRKKSA